MSLVSDLRYLRRSMARSPGPAVAVWACTAVWVAMAPAILSLLGALEWRALPFPRSDRIVHVDAGLDLVPTLADTDAFQAVASYEAGWLVAEGPRGAGAVLGAVVGEEFFQVFASRPLAGRVFAPGGGASDAGAAVLTQELSRHLFGSAVPRQGATFRADGRKLAVLGVIADRPVFPPRAQLWVLGSSGILPDGSFPPAEMPRLGIVGRLAAAASVRAADATARLAARELERRESLLQGDVAARTLESVLRQRSGGERGILLVSLAGLLGFVLLAYVSALAGFLAERQGELALRVALGARRRHLVRLLGLEVLLLALPGLVTGLPLAGWVLDRLAGLVPGPLAELVPPRLDLGILALAAAAWLAVSLLSAAVVWGATPQAGLGSVLRKERAEGKRTRPQARTRLAIVCAALSLAVALGASAAVLRQSFANLRGAPLGFEPQNRVSAVVRFAEPPAPAGLPALLERLAGRLEKVPGVAAVSFSDAIPIASPGRYLEVGSEDGSELWLSRIQGIQGPYLQAAGLSLLAGRSFSPQEESTGAAVALLDFQGAREIFAGLPPLGRTILFKDQPLEIVGVVASTPGSWPGEPRRPQLYLPLRGRYTAKGPPALAVLARVSEPVREADFAAAVAGLGVTASQYRRLPEIVEASLAPDRLARDLAVLQWTAALVLAALATFGTFSWLLELRSQELALRLALGDTKAGIARRVLRSALGVTLAAVLLGLAIYLPAGQALRALLFGVEALNPLALLEAAAAVGLVTLGAAALAVRSALRRLSLDLLKDQAG